MKQVVDWLYSKNPELTGEIGTELDLIEGRLVDSLDFLEFIYLLEEVSGRPIDLGTVSVDDFRTLARIEERFLSAGPALQDVSG
ncbi:acyl carrier protein [Streptomyces sp. NPDC087901]|uniref:acyl carrier protein n=1 Tax=unclassified Streptomyces TaxID=2593676 RepID=UPI003428D52E